ncbi:uncharacterized protein BDR25DRAFT_57903 [Lindgomyces ingoldianus]|uniref:Uncharacterized protein n=1 Tax=Lindgomyces ingoldianus TaxID=673940 RepID=A0ACB6QPP9_9PLEO|nr:uncharacterized protein BDR25DRAFT_57903 [Lindgomyces ingoldianus]KAF2468126.1 hypothetical protein BDR25DRAFT_57903 [Lindgomyces ingoldianus]
MALLAQTLRRSLLEMRCSLPPTFLLPFRANITVSHTLETVNTPEQPTSQDPAQNIQDSAGDAKKLLQSASSSKPTPHAREDKVQTLVTPSIRQLLPLLYSQPSHYLTIHIHGRPYLLTQGDTVRLPFLMPKVQPGDLLRLNRATHIGSRDYTLKAPEPVKGTRDMPKKIHFLDERLFVCRARVVGIESEPMRLMEKTKRRQRHIKTVKSKHRYTVLKISDIRVRSLEEYENLVAGHPMEEEVD